MAKQLLFDDSARSKMLKGVDKPSIGSFVIDMFAKLDTDGNQHLSYKEFAELYNLYTNGDRLGPNPRERLRKQRR